MIAEIQTAPHQPPTFTLDQAAQLRTPEQEMQMLGISSQYELQRYQNVSEVAGHNIAMAEIRRNTHAYEREFLQDIPVGEPHTYFHINGELHSEAIDHDLFRVASQIDPREREGRTLMGFNSFQEQVAQAQDGEVVMWYSPAGKAGSEGPFSNIYFDSGRLYLAFKDSNGQSKHIDIKIDEKRFPIQLFLDQYGKVSLDNAINSHLQLNDFISSLHLLDEQYELNQPVYISQHDLETATGWYLTHIIDEIAHQIRSSQTNLTMFNSMFNSAQSSPHQVITQQDIQHMYVQAIQSHVDHNGGEARLYGCSTTSVIKAAREIGQDTDFSGWGSRYSTMSRIMGLAGNISGTNFKEDPNLCKCSDCKGPHFHCPREDCKYAIEVGKGIEKCPKCGEGKRC